MSEYKASALYDNLINIGELNSDNFEYLIKVLRTMFKNISQQGLDEIINFAKDQFDLKCDWDISKMSLRDLRDLSDFIDYFQIVDPSLFE